MPEGVPRILVAGIGNIFYGDDGFGSEVARLLGLASWPENVRVADFGIRGFDLNFALLENFDVVILIDATPRGGVPGSVSTLEPDLSVLDRIDRSSPTADVHGIHPMRLLALARSMGARFRRVYLVGCEPSPDWIAPDGPGRIGFSEPVENAIKEAIHVVKTLVAQSMGEHSGKASQAGGNV